MRNTLTDPKRMKIAATTLLALAAGYAVSGIGFDGLSEAGSLTLGIFITAMILWVAEPFPLYVTSFVIVILEVVLLGRPGGPLGMSGSEYSSFLEPFFSSVVVLLLGGFVMAQAVKKYGLDEWISGKVLGRAGKRPGTVLLAMMGMSAFFSMWISNTATTALMMAVALPVAAALPGEEPFRKALILGIPFAANIGGIGTPIGSPPNAIAIGFLAQAGIDVSFLGWMVIGLPVVAVMTLVCWAVLFRLYRPRVGEVSLGIEKHGESLDGKQKFILLVFLAVVVLWLTSGLHGIPSAIVALLPLVVLFGAGLLEEEDLRELGWGILFIVGGGMSLGVAMSRSGLSEWIVSLVPFQSMPPIWILLVFAVTAAIMTTFISNSATANLLLPIVVGITAISPQPAAFVVALTSSAAMILPVSTPPNAIAYGSGRIRIGDMAGPGSAVTLIAIILITLFVYAIF